MFRPQGAIAGGDPLNLRLILEHNSRDRDAKRVRGERPFVFTNLKIDQGPEDIVRFIEMKGLMRHEGCTGAEPPPSATRWDRPTRSSR